MVFYQASHENYEVLGGDVNKNNSFVIAYLKPTR
jgi:hypothetical protein